MRIELVFSVGEPRCESKRGRRERETRPKSWEEIEGLGLIHLGRVHKTVSFFGIVIDRKRLLLSKLPLGIT